MNSLLYFASIMIVMLMISASVLVGTTLNEYIELKYGYESDIVLGITNILSIFLFIWMVALVLKLDKRIRELSFIYWIKEYAFSLLLEYKKRHCTECERADVIYKIRNQIERWISAHNIKYYMNHGYSSPYWLTVELLDKFLNTTDFSSRFVRTAIEQNETTKYVKRHIFSLPMILLLNE